MTAPDNPGSRSDPARSGGSAGRPAPIADLGTVLGTVGDLVAAVRADQWDRATPCPDWDVRRLVTHMILGHRLFAGILRGRAGLAPNSLDPDGPEARDVLGDDPAASYRAAADDLLTAFGRPGVLEEMFRVPVGPVPGIAAVHLRAVEELVHGWDLAQATGQRVRFPDHIVQRASEFTAGKLADVPPDQSPFAPPQPAPAGALPLDRLAALLGRTVEPEAPGR